MPRFWRRKSEPTELQSPWFVKLKNTSPPPPAYTFQLDPIGIQILKELGLESGDAFPAEQFWTLWDLGLTYTLTESDDDPDINTLLSDDNGDKPDLQQLTPEQQVTFITAILDDREIASIEASGFYRLLQSIEHGPREPRFTLLEHMTEATPVSPGPVDGMVGSGYTSSVFGALVCQAFNTYLDGLTGTLTGDYEVLGHNNGYSYIILTRAAWGTIQALNDFSLDVPQPYLNDVLPEDTPTNWERPILEAIHESQFLGHSAGKADSTVGHLIFEGLEQSKTNDDHGISTSPKTLLIVPQDALANTEIDRIV